MNKLILGSNDKIDGIVINKDTNIYLKLEKSIDINITIDDGVNVELFYLNKNVNNNICFNIGSRSSLVANSYGINNSCNIIFNLKDNSNLIYNLSIINKDKNSISEDINHLGENINSKVINHCVNYSSDVFKFLVNSNVYKDSNNTSSIQDNKIINMNSGKNIIEPNLIVDNDLVDIEHSAYIGEFSDEVYFYLESRGLSKDSIDRLLIEGFLIGDNLNSEEKEEVIDFLNI